MGRKNKIKTKYQHAQTVWLSGLSMVPCTKSLLVMFQVRAYARIASLISSKEGAGGGQSMFLYYQCSYHFSSPQLKIKINKQKDGQERIKKKRKLG